MLANKINYVAATNVMDADVVQSCTVSSKNQSEIRRETIPFAQIAGLLISNEKSAEGAPLEANSSFVFFSTSGAKIMRISIREAATE